MPEGPTGGILSLREDSDGSAVGWRSEGVTRSYLRLARKRTWLLAILLVVTIGTALLAVTHGAYHLDLASVWWSLVGKPAEGPAGIVVWQIRMPRIAAALVVGGGLGLAGLSLQALLRNPLGSPSTLGISQGAAFGAACAIILFEGRVLSVSLFAFCGAMGATLIILSLGRLRRLSPEAVILAGVALSSLFGAGTILVQYLSDETRLAQAVVWSFGDVGRSGWREIGLLTLVACLAAVHLARRRWDLNALEAGEETARGLGVPVERLRFEGLLAAALVSALATAFHGVIAFVGLIAPHMARRLVGPDHRFLVPASGVLGSFLLLAADTLGRAVMGSGALPVGVITSFLGAPLFLGLLIRGTR